MASEVVAESVPARLAVAEETAPAVVVATAEEGKTNEPSDPVPVPSAAAGTKAFVDAPVEEDPTGGAAGRATKLTSTAIPKTPNGAYDFDCADWLLPHETVRREFLRLEHALAHIDPIAAPWKVFTLREWLTRFFWTAIHAHHDIEEHVVGPFFKEIFPEEPLKWGQEKTHEDILAAMDGTAAQVDALCTSLKALRSSPSADGEAAARAAFARLKADLLTVKADMLVHLHEEEMFWPRVYRRAGKAAADAVLQRILKVELAKKGAAHVAFKAITGALVDGIASSNVAGNARFYTPPAHALALPPWPSVAFADEFMLKVPWVPRTFIFPAWHREYLTRWKRMIDSLSGDENVMGIDGSDVPPAVTCCRCAA